MAQAQQKHDRLKLFTAYAENPSVPLRNRLATLNDGLALESAHRWKRLCDVPFDDLVQIARIGLLKSIEQFKPGLGNEFSSFAVPVVNGEIQHFLRDHAWDLVKVRRRAIECASGVRAAHRRVIASGRTDAYVSESRVAQSLGLSQVQWQQTAEETARKPIVSLDDVNLPSPDEDDRVAITTLLRRNLAALPNPYRTCLTEHYLAGLDAATIAKRHRSKGFTLETVSLWLRVGVQRLQESCQELSYAD